MCEHSKACHRLPNMEYFNMKTHSWHYICWSCAIGELMENGNDNKGFADMSFADYFRWIWLMLRRH